MALVPLNIPPGVYHNGTEYQAKGRWYDANLVRWFEGTTRPIGGWVKKKGGSPRADLQVSGLARGCHAWRDNSGTPRYAIGTHTKLYTGSLGSSLYDATPTLTPAFVTGRANSTSSIGYGSSVYGGESYGVARAASTATLDATTWSMDNFGELLMAVQSDDGRILKWDPSVPGAATLITPTSGTVPVSNQALVVTQERFLLALGADGYPNRVAWCDQEDYQYWNYTNPEKQAGYFDLQSPGRLQLGKRVRGTTLLLTTTDAHLANYLGAPYVYGFDRIGSGCGVVSKNACVAVDDIAVWMGGNGFWIYDGYVKPLPCEVSDYVFANINVSQQAKVYAVPNTRFFEIWWFFPSESSNECDSYVVWNYRESHWTVGTVPRTCGLDAGVLPAPLWVAPDGYLYDHETGWSYDGAMPWVKSGPVEFGDGDQTMMVRQLVPDQSTLGDVQMRFGSRFYPTATEYEFGPYSAANPTSVRFSGRQAFIQVEGASFTDWRLGVPRVDAAPGGRR